MADEFSPWEREQLDVFFVIGHELAATAYDLQSDYASAQLRLGADELVVFTYERGRVWVTGKGFDVELSRLSGW